MISFQGLQPLLSNYRGTIQRMVKTTVSRVERRLRKEAKFWVPLKNWTFAQKLMWYSKLNSNRGIRKKLSLFEFLKGQNSFCSHVKLSFAVTWHDCKTYKLQFQLHFVSLIVSISIKLHPLIPIRIEFWMKYQILGFLTGTQILVSLCSPGKNLFLTRIWDVPTSGSGREVSCSCWTVGTESTGGCYHSEWSSCMWVQNLLHESTCLRYDEHPVKFLC